MIIKMRYQPRVFAEDGDECYGLTIFPSPKRVMIRISRALNKTVAQYGATLLHELIHVWVHYLTTIGWESIYGDDTKLENDVEEEFVLSAERVVLLEFKKYFKKGERANGK